MNEPDYKDLFLQSLNRCTASQGFIPAFYDRFLASSADIRIKFSATDFDHQKKMLLRSLELSAGATSGEAKSLQELKARGETHDREHLNIRPELYDFWLTALLETACEFDDHWNDETEAVWRRILGYVIKHMTKAY